MLILLPRPPRLVDDDLVLRPPCGAFSFSVIEAVCTVSKLDVRGRYGGVVVDVEDARTPRPFVTSQNWC